MLEKKEVRDPFGQKKIFTTGKMLKNQQQQLSMSKPKPKPKPAVKALKSRVACLIFARRMGEVHPKRFALMKRRPGFIRKLGMGFHQYTKFVHRFDMLFIASTAVLGILQIKRYFLK